MPRLQIGFIDSKGHPRLRILVGGTNPGVRADLNALIDTGFTGFLMLPLAQAFPLGLTLIGTADYILADGSPITNFTAKGSVTIPAPTAISNPNNPQSQEMDFIEETAEGIIVLAGDEAMIGMEFLTSLNKFLIVGRSVALISELPNQSPAKAAKV